MSSDTAVAARTLGSPRPAPGAAAAAPPSSGAALLAALLLLVHLAGCAGGADVLHAITGDRPGGSGDASGDASGHPRGDTSRGDTDGPWLGGDAGAPTDTKAPNDTDPPPDTDAPGPGCGDGACGAAEDCLVCPADCGCADGQVCGSDGRCGAAPVCGGEPCPAPPPGFGAAGCDEADRCRAVGPGGPDDGGPPPEALLVPAGTFPMGGGEPAGTWDGDRPAHAVTVEAYWIDRFEVTAGAYAGFLTARGANACGEGACVDPDVSTRVLEWDGAAATPRAVCASGPDAPATASCAAHPMVEVSWYGAAAFCEARGARLCTESEWERAARRPPPDEAAPYPWGDAPPAGRANCPEAACADGFEATAPVGSFPEGRSWAGADDLAGNAWEWVADDWHDDYGTPGAPGGAGHPTDGSAWIETPRASDRVARGGSFRSRATAEGVFELRVTRRAPVSATQTSAAGGFRCCHSP